MSIKDVKIFPIKDDKTFEELCLDLWHKKLDQAQLNGRSGQKENGVDIFGRKLGTSKWVGIQCKAKGTGERLTESDIQDEINKALTFNPTLAEYVIATTASRDVNTQQFARNITDQHRQKGLFSVSIVSWDDIELDLRNESNIPLLYKSNMN